MEQGPQTHRGAEWGHASVSGTDGQVVESNGLPVQLHISTGEIRNSPGCRPGEAGVSREWLGVVGSPGLFPLPPVSLTGQGKGPPAPPASGPAKGWDM